MTETALLIAQVAVLLVLFGFVWAVVRSSSRTIGRAAPPPLPLEDPVQHRSDTAAHAAVPAVPFAPPPARPAWDDLPPPPAELEPEPPTVTPPVPDPFADHIARRDHEPPLLTEEDEAPATESGARVREPASSTAQVLAAGIEPRLVVEDGGGLAPGAVFSLGGGLTIGRSRSNDLPVDDSYVSHMHARILRRGSFYHVEDLGSTNGTFLNDQRIESAQLRPRDVLRIGETTLRYEE